MIKKGGNCVGDYEGECIIFNLNSLIFRLRELFARTHIAIAIKVLWKKPLYINFIEGFQFYFAIIWNLARSMPALALPVSDNAKLRVSPREWLIESLWRSNRTKYRFAMRRLISGVRVKFNETRIFAEIKKTHVEHNVQNHEKPCNGARFSVINNCCILYKPDTNIRTINSSSSGWRFEESIFNKWDHSQIFKSWCIYFEVLHKTESSD